MNRITEKHLAALVHCLNRAMGRPESPYTESDDGQPLANIGNFHLSYAYGGVCVHEMANAGGGVNHALGMYGHVTKRECAAKLEAALWAIEEIRGAK